MSSRIDFVNISANNDDNDSPLGQNFSQILAITWAIIGEFDNFGQIQAFKYNFGPIYGLESVYCDLL